MPVHKLHITCVIWRPPVDLAGCDVLAVCLDLLQVGRPQLQPVRQDNSKVGLTERCPTGMLQSSRLAAFAQSVRQVGRTHSDQFVVRRMCDASAGRTWPWLLTIRQHQLHLLRGSPARVWSAGRQPQKAPGPDELPHGVVRLLELGRNMPPVVPRQQRRRGAADLRRCGVDVPKGLPHRLQQRMPTSALAVVPPLAVAAVDHALPLRLR
jgi:hypothetical protein